MTLYEILGVARDATEDQIKKAYHAKSRQHHPDHAGPSASATEQQQRINEAYRVLSDKELRARYDQALLDASWSAEDLHRVNMKFHEIGARILNRDKVGALEHLEKLAKDPAIQSFGSKLWERVKKRVLDP